MKVFLAGEGRDELGKWFDHPGYRDDKNHPGLIEAFLTNLEIDYMVTDGKRWRNLLKYEAGDGRSEEMKNVMGAAQEALDLGCDAVVFVRDLDSAPWRETDIAKGIEKARAEFPDLRICGGVAIQEIEAWILALKGDHGSETHRDAKEVLKTKHGVERRNQKVEVVRAADLTRTPSDAVSLNGWLNEARALNS